MRKNKVINKIILILVIINLVLFPIEAKEEATIKNYFNANQLTPNNNFNKITLIDNNLLNNKKEKISLFVVKYSPDFSSSTANCLENQCYTGFECLNNTQFDNDDYCENGRWTTRTKLVALELLNLTRNSPNKYNLFCDEYDKSINYGVERLTTALGTRTEKFCVLTYFVGREQKAIIGAVIKSEQNITDIMVLIPTNPPRLPDRSYCNNVIQEDGKYYPCNRDDVWYNKKPHTIIFSKEDINLNPQTLPLSHLFIQNQLAEILNIFGVAPFNTNWINNLKPLVENTSYFNKLFILHNGTKQIFAVLEENKWDNNTQSFYDYLVINYEGLFSDICASVNKSKNIDEYTKCEQKGISNFVISKKTQYNPNIIINSWPELTAQLRLQDVPDTWPPRINSVWVEPDSAPLGTMFIIFVNAVDTSGINPTIKANVTFQGNVVDNGINIDFTKHFVIEDLYYGFFRSGPNNQIGRHYVDIFVQDGSGNSITRINATSFEIREPEFCGVYLWDCGYKKILSLSSISDAHVATDLNYYPYKLCCNFSANTEIIVNEYVCTNGIHLLSVSGNLAPYNDQHAGDQATFNNVLCLRDSGVINCLIKTTCDVQERCILSIPNQEEGHVSACTGTGAFQNKLCCEIR